MVKSLLKDSIFVDFVSSFTPISELDLIGLYVIPHAHPCRRLPM